MKWILLIITMAALFSCKNGQQQSTCIEKPCEGPCVKIYKPVCGCNDKTYSNSCIAECHGITDYKEGACPGKEE